MDELRHLFTLSASAVDRARAFRDERIALITKGIGTRPLVGNGRFILHIIPLSAVSSTATLDLSTIYSHHEAFWPLGSSGNSPRFNFEGLINERAGATNYGYTQIFRNGIIEATKGCIVKDFKVGKAIPASHLEDAMFRALGKYIDGLKSINVEPPLIVMITLEGVEGAYYHIHGSSYDFEDVLPVIDRPVLSLPDCVIEDFGTEIDYHRAVKPAIDALWNSAGYIEAQSFGKSTGEWRGNPS